MAIIPTPFVTMDIAWGEGKKHLYCPDDHSLKFHPNKTEARSHADAEIQNGSKMVGIFKLEMLMVAKAIEYKQITP